MSPLPDTHETAFEEVASALWAYTRYSEESWAGDRTGVDGVTHVLVNRRAEALNRRESGLDRGLEIAGLL